MAKIEKTQTEVTLSSETKRYLRNLTSALEKVARGMAMYQPQGPKEGPKRLSEPFTDEFRDGYTTGMADAEKVATSFPREVRVDAAAVQNLAQSTLNQKSYLQ